MGDERAEPLPDWVWGDRFTDDEVAAMRKESAPPLAINRLPEPFELQPRRRP